MVLNIATLFSNSTRIIDSCVIYHVTFDSKHISHLKSLLEKNISISNCNTTPIIGEGSVTFIDILNLEYVLIVPFLYYNLMSASYLT